MTIRGSNLTAGRNDPSSVHSIRRGILCVMGRPSPIPSVLWQGAEHHLAAGRPSSDAGPDGAPAAFLDLLTATARLGTAPKYP